MNKNGQLQVVTGLGLFIIFSTTINIWSSNKDLKQYASFSGFILLCFVFVEMDLFKRNYWQNTVCRIGNVQNQTLNLELI